MVSHGLKQIAIVDDEVHLRESLKDLLETAGYSSRLYHSADYFLQEKGYLGVGCILADVRMPGMSGMELLQVLQSIPDCPPAIIMTSYADDHMRLLAMRLGAASFLSKPIDSTLLFDTINAVMGSI
jgi:two-component system, LuxR family, response regulator FixJ